MDRQPEWVTLNRLHPKESIDRPQEASIELFGFFFLLTKLFLSVLSDPLINY